MKRILILICLGLISFLSSYGQQFTIHQAIKSADLPEFTDFSKIWVTPLDIFYKQNKLMLGIDTLNDHYLRATEFVTYAVNIQGNDYPLTGTNPIYYFLGEKFPVITSGSIEGILISVSFKVVGTLEDSLVVSVYNSNQENGLPDGSPIGTEYFFLENLDTNLTSPKFSYINFKDPVNYSTPFVVMVLTRSIRVNNNGYVVFSNKHGDGANQERCCVLIYTQNGWVSTNLGNVIQLEGVPIDIDPMIIPIVKTDPSDVSEKLGFNTFRIEKILTDQDQSKLKLILSSFENNQYFNITIVDLKGNIVGKSNILNDYPTDKLEFDIDINELKSGNYFCIINSGKDKIATKFSIIR